MNNDAKLRNQYSETLDPTQPLVTATIEGQSTVSMSEIITYNGKSAAGAVSINNTICKPILSVGGDRIASFWGLDKNKVYEASADGMVDKDTSWLTALVETNGSATFSIYDPNLDLESAFESVIGTVKRFVARLTDRKGKILYGWIMGVAVSGGVYTFDICNNRLTETRNWVGSLAGFDNTILAKVEIFNYNSSLTFGTGSTATEEVACPREYSKSKKAQIDYANRYLTNGQYIVDSMRGWIIVKKADTTASETITYKCNSPARSGGEYRATDLSLVDLQTAGFQFNSRGDLKVMVNSRTSGEALAIDRLLVEEQCTYVNISASALIKTGTGRLMGYMINSASAGATIKFWDQTTAAVPVLMNTITYAAAATQGGDNKVFNAISFVTGLYCTITGTMDVTLFISAT